MSKERFKHIENDIVNYIDDDKTDITYIATNYYDMNNLTKLLNKQDQTISDLEAKLAESEKEKQEFSIKYKYWRTECEQLKQQLAEKDEQLQQANEIINNPETLIYQQQELIDNLKVQLAEKEEIIKMLKDDNADIRSQCQRFSDDYREIALKQQMKCQDKISFCIEKLEKVKEIINKNYFYNMSSDSCTFDKLEVDFQIDNQIASLKKGVE